MESVMYYFVMAINLINVIVPLYVLIRSLDERPSTGETNFLLLMFSIMINSLGNVITFMSESVESAIIGGEITAIARVFCLIYLEKFVLSYCNFEVKKSKKTIVSIMNVIIVIGVIVTTQYKTYFDRVILKKRHGVGFLEYRPRTCYLLFILMGIYIMMTLLFNTYKKIRECEFKSEKNRYLVVFIGILSPLVGLSITGLRIAKFVDVFSVSLMLSSLCCYIGIEKFEIFNMIDNTKDYLLNNSVEAIMVVDTEKNILYMNDIVKYVNPSLKLFKQMDSEYQFLFENEVNQYEQMGYHFESYRTEIRGDDDYLLGYLIEVRNSTEKIEKRKAVEKLMHEAEAANQAKNTFLSYMSHEIRTPISVVLGMNEMIIRETEDEVIEEYAHNIQTAGKTLLSIINDILDFSKIDSGELEIVQDKYDLINILENAKRMVLPRLEGKDIKFKMNINPKIPKSLFGDNNRIEQCMINILTNAAKYTEKGEINVTVDFEKHYSEEDDDVPEILLKFEVQDTGKGIKESDLKKLFKSFQRVDEKNNRNIEGTGLGLAISQSLIKKMGGQIKVESEYGKGSVFTIEVPQRVIDFTGIGDGEKKKWQTEKYKEQFHAPDAKILVVDDNVVNIKVVQGMLKKTKVQIIGAKSGFECLDLLKQQKFDLILMDHLMPELDGVETLERIKIMEENLSPDIPIIALTANAIQGVKEMYLKKGFTDYMMKPVDSEILEKMLIMYLPDELVEMTKNQ